MGYHAPSAEEVYAYIFRVDRHAPRSLCDGFGWSILFVNDGSRACQDFLVRYGTELCYRTADRVRFVFFSGLTDEETNELASRANGEWGNRQRVGFLPRIIETIERLRRPSTRFEWERDQWDELRPRAFQPLDSRELIECHLDMECEINSAMPGAEEALLFAQRVGIGRFVPCFLLFSDVGSPSVCLFPVAGRSPDLVFGRLRGWIDTFYEVNNPILEHWSKVEESIETVSREFESSVHALSRWREERLEAWKTLQKLAFYEHALRLAAPKARRLDEIIGDNDLTWEIRELVSAFRDQWHSTEQRIAKAHGAMEWIERLKSLQNGETIRAELLRFRDRPGAGLPESVHHAITAAVKVFTAPPPSLPPDECVVEWWRSEHGRPLSRNRYDKHRSAWVAYSKAKYGMAAVGHAGNIRGAEFAVVQEAAAGQLVDCDPQSAADEALLALGQHLGVSGEDSSWRQAISGYRDVLVDYFTRLKNHAPAWIAEFGSVSVPSLRWAECIPTVDQLQENPRNQCLRLLPRLSAIAERASREWDATTGAAQRKRLEQQSDALTAICSCVEAWVSAGSSLEADKLSIWLAVVSSLSGIRKDLEDQLFARAKEGRAALFPGRVVSPDDATRLLMLLDEYHEAVGSLTMPFENDSEVLRLSLGTPLGHISGLRQNEQAISPVTKARDRLLKAVADAEKAMGEWDSVRCAAGVYSPAGRLCHVLRNTIPPARLEELQSGLGAEDPEEAIVALSDRGLVDRVLNRLHLQELLAVENAVCAEVTRSESAKPDTKAGILQSILVAIGLAGGAPSADDGRCPTDLLKKKASRGEFDVFLAHNSQDRESVLCLGSRLRGLGIYPWIDVEQVPPGRWFQDVLQSAIRTVKSAAIIIGTSGVGRWQVVEMRAFVSRCVEGGIPVIPVLLPGTSTIPDEFLFLEELKYVRFEQNVTEDAGIASLFWGITGKKLDSS